MIAWLSHAASDAPMTTCSLARDLGPSWCRLGAGAHGEG
jgi:hypothetical protein